MYHNIENYENCFTDFSLLLQRISHSFGVLFTDRFTVRPVGFNEEMTVTVEVVCECDCESQSVSISQDLNQSGRKD